MNLSTLTFTVRQEGKLIIPTHAGSMLRGAFGIALRHLSCLTELPDCQHCPLKTLCPYTQLFENTDNNSTNPYVLRLPKAQSILPHHTWQFGMTLIGTATKHYEPIIKAWQEALLMGIGGGRHRATAKLIKVTNMGQTVFEQEKFAITQARSLKSPPMPDIDSPSHLGLHFMTPFRLQYQGKIAHQSHQFEPKQLLINLYNRIARRQTCHDNGNDWQIGYKDFYEFLADVQQLTFDSKVSPVNINCHSSRQGRKITLFGLTGDDNFSRLLTLLWIGQYVHVGAGSISATNPTSLDFYKLMID